MVSEGSRTKVCKVSERREEGYQEIGFCDHARHEVGSVATVLMFYTVSSYYPRVERIVEMGAYVVIGNSMCSSQNQMHLQRR